MPPKKPLETGQRFGKLVVIEQSHNNKYGKAMYLCQCDCGRPYIGLRSSLVAGHTKSCGCGRNLSQENSNNWKGGRRIIGGYIYIHCRSNNYSSPYDPNKIYVAEHIMVMEQYIGRYLKPEETVHHKNDNRIENLELWASNHPNGQRVEDLIAYAWKIIQQYNPEFKNIPDLLMVEKILNE